MIHTLVPKIKVLSSFFTDQELKDMFNSETLMMCTKLILIESNDRFIEEKISKIYDTMFINTMFPVDNNIALHSVAGIFVGKYTVILNTSFNTYCSPYLWYSTQSGAISFIYRTTRENILTISDIIMSSSKLTEYVE